MTSPDPAPTSKRECAYMADARVLVIDDDSDIHALVTAMLKPLHVAVLTASDAASGLAEAAIHRPDLILLDQELPDLSGLETLRTLRQQAELASVPVIIVTASESREVLTACFAAGAADYLRKPFFGAELRARVCSVIERQRMFLELGRAAHLDALTGLPNRCLLQWRMQHAIEHATADRSYTFALMFIDFDRFKLINDSLGHDVGDLLLMEIAARLKLNMRANDTISRDAPGSTVARLGGDEFVVLLDNVGTAAEAQLAADRVLATLEEPYRLNTHLVRSSASIGIVHSDGAYRSPVDMLRDADIAMYEAKARGKGCHVLFTPGMRDTVQSRLETETALRDALLNDEMFLVYQPIISLDDRSLQGVEALVRWRHPVLGDVSPESFIPIAEESRLILPLSDIVLRKATTQFVEWQRVDPARAPTYVSVNLSRVQLADPDLVERILRIVQETGINPGQLQLEVTESHLMHHQDLATTLLSALKDAGIRLAMDDFGSGYSSLSCLQEYPFDVLKMDRALTGNVNRGRGYSALLHAVVTLSENLGLEVVAEGIENLEQVALLQALGCPAGQGFFLCGPLKADALVSWWSSSARARMEAA